MVAVAAVPVVLAAGAESRVNTSSLPSSEVTAAPRAVLGDGEAGGADEVKRFSKLKCEALVLLASPADGPVELPGQVCIYDCKASMRCILNHNVPITAFDLLML